MAMYTDRDRQRFVSVPNGCNFRSEFRRDFARVVHSPSFRRLQGKTQLYPGVESDFFRNRLTHSLEVAQIAKSIAMKLNHEEAFLQQDDHAIDLDVVELAGLCHDLGHPPFGHNGEYALDRKMLGSGGFEGNAQTFRILHRLEEREVRGGLEQRGGVGPDGNDARVGLNLTHRSLAAILKYDTTISHDRSTANGGSHPIKGTYDDDKQSISAVKDAVRGDFECEDGQFKTIECGIMDLADDIAYSTYDLEDSFKAGFLSPLDLVAADDEVIAAVTAKVVERMDTDAVIDEKTVRSVLQAIFEQLFPDDTASAVDAVVGAVRAAQNLCSSGKSRIDLTSELVNRHIHGIQFTANGRCPALSRVSFTADVKLQVEVLKNFTYQSMILKPDMKVVARRGEELVETIFDSISARPDELLPGVHRRLYSLVDSRLRNRVVADFVAGMTDRYAAEYFGRLRSENPQSLFKPL